MMASSIALSCLLPLHASELDIHQSPLFLTNSEKANVLVLIKEGLTEEYKDTNTPKPDSSNIRSAVRNLMASYVGKINMGLMTYDQSSVVQRGGRRLGYIDSLIKNLDQSQLSALEDQLALEGRAAKTNGIQKPAFRSLNGSLKTAKRYFAGNSLSIDEGGPVMKGDLPQSCGKNYVALLANSFLPPANKGGDLSVLKDIARATKDLNDDGIETYLVGLAASQQTESILLNQIAISGGTGSAYLANHATTIQAKINAVFNDILIRANAAELAMGSASSLASNSASLTTNSHVYQAKFSSEDWSGKLLAKKVSIEGQVKHTPKWDAGALLNEKKQDDRVILSYNLDTKKGVPFRWRNIDAQGEAAVKKRLNTNPLSGKEDKLGKERVEFLRGGSAASSKKLGFKRANKLGDIVHSAPFYVGEVNAGFNDFDMPGYHHFRVSQTQRTPMVYVGANDGMMHGFDATTGEELLAYIPRAVYANLMRLTSSRLMMDHRYLVDGSPLVADAYANGWKTVLVGGLNAGGQGLYALNITDPNTFAEHHARQLVLWEFSDKDDADLGFTYIQPTVHNQTHQSGQIRKMANGRWAVIVGNGYNNTQADGHVSTTGNAYLYVLFLEGGLDGTWREGTDYIKLDTGIGSIESPNGMATPTSIDEDGDGQIDMVYAGDLRGNLWKFDVSDVSPINWGIATASNNPLFTAKVSDSTAQPIMTAPLVTVHPDGGYMVGFGTGKYLELSDIYSTEQQSFYGIWDQGAVIYDRSQLVSQTVIGTQSVGSTKYRIGSLNKVHYPSDKGWYIDFPESGERVDVNPVIRDGRFVFITRIPSVETCLAGGSSWLMEVDYLTGGRLPMSPFDISGDKIINDEDLLRFSNDKIVATGRQSSEDGMLSSPIIIETDNAKEEYKVIANSKGNIKSTLESAKDSFKGRIAWEEIR